MGLVTSSTGKIVTIKSSGDYPSVSAPWDIVNTRFEDTLARADEMLDLLVGANGDGGYLGAMNSAIAARPAVSVSVPPVDTNISLTSSVGGPPVFDDSELGTFPTDTYADPTLATVPTVDTSGLVGATEPTTIDPSLAWTDGAYSSDVYADLLARILADLQSGATGLDPTVEQAIYDRARLRQQADRLVEYNRINNTAAELHFQFPSGVLLAGLADYSIGAARQDADIENQIITTQADLAQKNSQFVVQQAVALEQVLRQLWSEGQNRALDAKKAGVDFLIRDYAERWRGFIARIEGQKAYIEAQVENLRGVIESNKGQVDIYREKYQALSTRIGAIAAKNKAVTDVYGAQVQGYAEEQRGIAAANSSKIEALNAKVKYAEVSVRAAISEAEQTVSGYASEQSLKEKLANDMASIAAQSVASWASAVNASASLGYSGSESKSESWGHSDSLSESHSYEHDPIS